MKKLNRKSIIAMSIVVVCTLSIIGYIIMHTNNPINPSCHDIIGDGYAMGTDLKPVVIGNTCDQ